MSKDNLFIGSINPLSFFEAEDIPGLTDKKLTYEAIVKYLSSETTVPEPENFKKSYKHISEKIHRLFIVPAEYSILNKLIFPLKNAIGSYMVGNFLGTIALCGMVAEMAIIFHYETLKIKINEKSSEEVVKELYNRNFERLGQDRRIKFLHVLGFLSDDMRDKFNIVRDCRREYLHLFSKRHDNAAPDAKKAFDATLDIVLGVLGLHIKDGKTIMNQNVIDYLTSKGLIEREVQPKSKTDLVSNYKNQNI